MREMNNDMVMFGNLGEGFRRIGIGSVLYLATLLIGSKTGIYYLLDSNSSHWGPVNKLIDS